MNASRWFHLYISMIGERSPADTRIKYSLFPNNSFVPSGVQIQPIDPDGFSPTSTLEVS